MPLAFSKPSATLTRPTLTGLGLGCLGRPGGLVRLGGGVRSRAGCRRRRWIGARGGPGGAELGHLRDARGVRFLARVGDERRDHRRGACRGQQHALADARELEAEGVAEGLAHVVRECCRGDVRRTRPRRSAPGCRSEAASCTVPRMSTMPKAAQISSRRVAVALEAGQEVELLGHAFEVRTRWRPAGPRRSGPRSTGRPPDRHRSRARAWPRPPPSGRRRRPAR